MIVLPFPPPATGDLCGAGSASKCADTQNPAPDLRRLLTPIGGRKHAEASEADAGRRGLLPPLVRRDKVSFDVFEEDKCHASPFFKEEE